MLHVILFLNKDSFIPLVNNVIYFSVQYEGVDLEEISGVSRFHPAREARRNFFGNPWLFLEPPGGGARMYKMVPEGS